MSFLAIIPARSGSKGIKNKNTIKIKNKSLIEYTFISAEKSKYIKKIILTTNDTPSIKIAQKYKKIQIYIRQNKLCKSNSLMSEVVFDALNKFKIEFPKIKNFILLQPTSPQRNYKDIDNSIRFFLKNKSKNLISISEPLNHPNEILSLNKKKYSFLVKRKKQMNRQEYKKFYFVNGSIFIGNIQKFIKRKKFLDNDSVFYKMSKKNSVDINDEFDKSIAEIFL